MCNKLSIIFSFSVGAAIGSIVTWKLVKTKYEQIADEEIESVKEVFHREREELEKNYAPEETDRYTTIVNNYASNENKEEEGGSDLMEVDYQEIEVIPDDEFGDYQTYDSETLNYFSDGVLTDDRGNVIEDPEAMVGPDALDSFGEWDDNVVYVRNDHDACYYEIIKCENDFYDTEDDPDLSVDE